MEIRRILMKIISVKKVCISTNYITRIMKLLSFSENENENVKNYCEICDVRFEEVKKHLSEYHVGEQVAIVSQIIFWSDKLISK